MIWPPHGRTFALVQRARHVQRGQQASTLRGGEHLRAQRVCWLGSALQCIQQVPAKCAAKGGLRVTWTARGGEVSLGPTFKVSGAALLICTGAEPSARDSASILL